MKLGFLVDGVTEYQHLRLIFDQLRESCRHTLGKVLKAPLQPSSTAPRMARDCNSYIKILEKSRVDGIVVLIDSEDPYCCTPSRSNDIQREFAKLSRLPVYVVIKQYKFENWLIADFDALVSLKSFRSSAKKRSHVVPDKADQSKCDEILGTYYDKVRDSKRILERANVQKMASNSRSFRKFLRVLGHKDYLDQSKLPR